MHYRKAFLANFEDWERDEIVSKIERTRFADKTITNSTDFLLELEKVKSCGYGLSMWVSELFWKLSFIQDANQLNLILS